MSWHTFPELWSEVLTRVERLEQTRPGDWVTAPDGTDVQSFPNGFIIGTGGEFVFDAIPGPTNVVVTSGSFFDTVYLDVDWDAPVGQYSEQTTEYEVEVTQSGAGVARYYRTSGTNARVSPVEPNTNYVVRVRAINKLNRSSAYVAAAPNPITTGADQTKPAAPTGVVASSNVTARAIQIKWNENTEVDVKNGKGLYEWEVSTSFAVDGNGNFVTPIRSDRTSATVISALDLTAGTTYYAHVRAIDSSGNFSNWSVVVGAAPGLLVDADIANLSAAKITFGEMSGDRISANTLSAQAIKTSNLDAAIVTITSGGMIRSGRTVAPFHYWIMDANGKRFYKDGTAAFTGGTLVSEESTATGNAFFGGSLTAGVSITSPVINGGQLNSVSLTTQDATFAGAQSYAWEAPALGTFGVLNSYARLSSVTAIGRVLIPVDFTDGLYSMRVKVSNTANRTNAGLVFRAVDGNNFWALRIIQSTSNVLRLDKYVGGAQTIVKDVNLTFNSGSTYHIRVYTSGSQIKCFVADQMYIAVSDSTHSAGTKAGIIISAAANQDDNTERIATFSAGSVADNFDRADSATLGSTTSLGQIKVDGSQFYTTDVQGSTSLSMRAATGRTNINGFLTTDVIITNSGVIDEVYSSDIYANNTQGTADSGAWISLDQNRLWLSSNKSVSNAIDLINNTGEVNYAASNVGHRFFCTGQAVLSLAIDRVNIWKGLAANDNALWWRGAGTIDRSEYDTAFGGPRTFGNVRSGISSVGGDVLLKADTSGASESRNNSDNGWKNHKCNAIEQFSDPIGKEQMVPIFSPLARVRNMKEGMVEFVNKPEFDPNPPMFKGRKNVATRADMVDEMIRREGYITDPSSGEIITCAMVDLGGYISLVAAALVELSDIVENIMPGNLPVVAKQALKALPPATQIWPALNQRPKQLEAKPPVRDIGDKINAN